MRITRYDVVTRYFARLLKEIKFSSRLRYVCRSNSSTYLFPRYHIIWKSLSRQKNVKNMACKLFQRVLNLFHLFPRMKSVSISYTQAKCAISQHFYLALNKTAFIF